MPPGDKFIKRTFEPGIWKTVFEGFRELGHIYNVLFFITFRIGLALLTEILLSSGIMLIAFLGQYIFLYILSEFLYEQKNRYRKTYISRGFLIIKIIVLIKKYSFVILLLREKLSQVLQTNKLQNYQKVVWNCIVYIMLYSKHRHMSVNASRQITSYKSLISTKRYKCDR